MNPIFQSLMKSWPFESAVPWDTALTMAEISRAAYLPIEPGSTVLAGMTVNKLNEFGLGPTNCLVASDEQFVVIAFRGTDDKFDAVIDALFIKHSTSEGDIHLGFYAAMNVVYDDVVKLALEHDADKKRVFITGHSLGGALAVLFAYEALRQKALQIESVITFGQPLVFCQKIADGYCEMLTGDYVRFVVGDDLVTMVPPFYYSHCGSNIVFMNGNYTMNWRKRQAEAMLAASSVPQAALTEEEYRMAQEEFRARASDREAKEPRLMRSSSIKLPPWLMHMIDAIKKQHSMENYIECIRACSQL